MNAAATIIFRPRKMWRVLEGSYYSRLYSHIIVHITYCEQGEPSGQSVLFQQYCAWAPHLQDSSVDSAEGWRDGRPLPLQAIADGVVALLLCFEAQSITFSLNMVSNFLFLSTIAVAISSPPRRIFALAAVIIVQSRVARLPLCLMTINVINVAFIQGQLLLCFTLLSVASTKWVRRLFEQIIT